MNKKGRVMVVVVGVILQLILSLLYGFSKVPVSGLGCFAIWCGCAFVVYQFVERFEAI